LLHQYEKRLPDWEAFFVGMARFVMQQISMNAVNEA